MKQLMFILVMLLAVNLLQAQEDSRPIRKNDLKITFLSFITGSAKLTYERVTFPKQSAEITGGIIGIGFDKFKVNPKGALVRAGYKFNLLQKENTALSGLYIKPEYAWSFFDYDSKNNGRVHSSMQTIMMCTGYQHEIKRLVLDGFVGAGAVIFLYFVFMLRMWRGISRAKDLQGSLIDTGILTAFAFQVFENIGMNMGIMPVTGIPLPLISSGGTAVVANMMAVGLVLNVGVRNKTLMFSNQL